MLSHVLRHVLAFSVRCVGVRLELAARPFVEKAGATMDQLLVGKLQGFLLAIAHLNVGPDHGPSYDVEAVAWKGDLLTSVRGHFCSYSGSTDDAWAVSMRPVEEGTEALSPLLHRWLFDRHLGAPEGNDAELWRSKMDACVREFLDMLTGLFGGRPPRAWKVDARPTDGSFYELVWDDIVLESGEQILLLHVGMSD